MENINKQAVLKIDLGRIAENYLLLKSKLKQNTSCAAVVKANSYGLGAEEVCEKLYESGCRDFYVAYFSEALDIKPFVKDSSIYVLHGFSDASIEDFEREGIIPVLNSVEDIKKCVGKKLPVLVHVDTGMNRLGISAGAIRELKDSINELNVKYIISHLACAEEADNSKNKEQLETLKKALSVLEKNHKVSFSNSSGVFLGEEYHFDQVRIGCALYGVNPQIEKENVVKNAVSLKAKVLQIRHVFPGETSGYGATYKIETPSKLATIAVGYADGIPRSWGEGGSVFVKEDRCKIVGRISMDSMVVDISKINSHIKCGDWVEIIGENQTPDDIAKQAKTIGYEILTSIGARYKVIYKH